MKDNPMTPDETLKAHAEMSSQERTLLVESSLASLCTLKTNFNYDFVNGLKRYAMYSVLVNGAARTVQSLIKAGEIQCEDELKSYDLTIKVPQALYKTAEQNPDLVKRLETQLECRSLDIEVVPDNYTPTGDEYVVGGEEVDELYKQNPFTMADAPVQKKPSGPKPRFNPSDFGLN